MKNFKLILLVALTIILAIVVLQNRQPWQIHLLWLRAELPAIILLLLIAAVGFVMGVIATILFQRWKRSRH